MRSPRLILHVDMDAFYAAVEQHDDPALAGRPLIVGGTRGRGVVAAASYEVRRYGVHSAMPMRQALGLCPHAICIPPRMARYRQVSEALFDILHSVTPLVEGLSLDEAYLDVSATSRCGGGAQMIAAALKARIRTELGLTASIGVAPNKLLAKIASEHAKPDGLVVVTPQRAVEFLDPLPVRRLPGLGRKAGERVAAAGLTTLGAIGRAAPALLWELFGRHGERLRQRARGIDERPVSSRHETRSISAEDTFAADIAAADRLQTALLRLVERLGPRLRAQGLAAACLTVKIRRHDFTTVTRQRRFAPPTSDSRILASVARGLLGTWLAATPGARLRLLGVGVSELVPAAQLALFEAQAAVAARSRLDAAADAIRARFGRAALVPASRLPPR